MTGVQTCALPISTADVPVVVVTAAAWLLAFEPQAAMKVAAATTATRRETRVHMPATVAEPRESFL